MGTCQTSEIMKNQFSVVGLSHFTVLAENFSGSEIYVKTGFKLPIKTGRGKLVHRSSYSNLNRKSRPKRGFFQKMEKIILLAVPAVGK